MITGNLWIYPPSIAQGWDSSLAHTSYYELKEEMIEYISDEGIGLENVGSAFPAIDEFRFYWLDNSAEKLKRKELGRDPYILYSNIYNDFTDEEVYQLYADYELIYTARTRGVFLELYRLNSLQNDYNQDNK